MASDPRTVALLAALSPGDYFTISWTDGGTATCVWQITDPGYARCSVSTTGSKWPHGRTEIAIAGFGSPDEYDFRLCPEGSDEYDKIEAFMMRKMLLGEDFGDAYKHTD